MPKISTQTLSINSLFGLKELIIMYYTMVYYIQASSSFIPTQITIWTLCSPFLTYPDSLLIFVNSELGLRSQLRTVEI